MNYFISLCVGLVVGIIVSHTGASVTGIVFCLVLASILFLDAYFLEQGFEKEKARVCGFILAFFFLGVCVGQVRTAIFLHFISHDLEQFESRKVTLRGVIRTVPTANGQTQKFTLAVSEYVSDDAPQKVSGNVAVTTDLFPVYHYGDEVSVSGQVKKPEMVVQDDGRVFDYPAYLLKDGITETITFGYIKSLGKNTGNEILKVLYSIEDACVSGIQRVLPEPNAGLLAGIVLGAQTLSKSLSNDFRVAGLSHIVVLSGYNITVVAESVMAVALFFAPVYATLIAVVSVVLFVLMSGAGASSVRAGVMSVIALIGRRYGKTYLAGRALFFACLVMIMWNPMIVLNDPSFHLSVLATIAIVYVSPTVLQRLHRVTEKYGIREILATTLSAQILVMPYILYISGNIQILSLPTNMLVLPFVPLTMFVGFLTAVCGVLPFSMGRFVGLIPGIPSYIITRYDIAVAQSVSSLPFAQISIHQFPLWLMLAIYAGLFYFVYKNNRPTPTVRTSDGYEVVGE